MKKRSYLLLTFVLLLILTFSVTVYHYVKPLPEGVSLESEGYKTDDVQFLYDLTYEDNGEVQSDQEIFQKIYDAIEEAEDFIVMDMFLFNADYDKSLSFPELSRNLVEKLVTKKKEQPNIKIVVVTDRINTFYGSYDNPLLQRLEEYGISVIYTNMKPLRDSNPLYSGWYRTFFQWFGTKGEGWLPNAFSSSGEQVTLRSYLELLNFKANHRKVFLNEKRGIISSANPHDASFYHSNIAVEVRGSILEDIVAAEKAVVRLSEEDASTFESMDVQADEGGEGQYEVQWLTEGKIKKHVIEEIEKTVPGDDIHLGMFYLSDRDVIRSLLEAGEKGVGVKLILDANKDAFGREKNGIPNRPVAHELVTESDGKIHVKWYRTHGEQYHTKMLYIKRAKGEDVWIGGSANYTKRNLDNFNLEANIKVTAPSDAKMMEEVDRYFERLWSNEEHTFTDEYEVYAEEALWKYVLYRFQEWSGISSF